MTSTVPNEAEDSAAAQAFLSGQVRDEIGLKSTDLAVGLEIAKNFLKRGAAPDALRVYVGLVLCEPANVDFQIGLANCALQIGQHHLALQAASVVIALSPRDPRGYLLSGRACTGLGAFEEAEEDLNEAVTFGRDARNAMVVEEARRLLDALPSGARQSASAAVG